MLISFVTSVFISQPIKAILFALLFAIIFKKPDVEDHEDDEDEEDPQLHHDEIWLHSGTAGEFPHYYTYYLSTLV